MPRLLADTETDKEQEQVDQALTEADEREFKARKLAPTDATPDLSDGGELNGVTMTPRQNGKKMKRGRAAARQAYMWNGTSSLIPLAWTPDGKNHDGGRRYLLKRHCRLCKTSGFRGRTCPKCQNNEPGTIVPAFYLKFEDAPEHFHAYGDVPCFLESCPRRGSQGFKSDVQMREHAMSRHQREYRAYVDSLAATRTDEIGILRAQINALTAAQLSRPVIQETGGTDEKARNRERVNRWRANKKKSAQQSEVPNGTVQ